MTGLFGGAFDPPHNGHLALVESALARFDLDRIVIVVTGDPPHKRVSNDAETRFALAEAAFSALPGVELSRIEIDRQGPSYTVDTVRRARERWGEIVFLVGADEFADFLSWRDPNGVLESARLGVATRPGYPRERLDAVVAGLDRPDRVEFFDIPSLPISSRELRERVRRGESIRQFVPAAVADRVDELRLYRCYPEAAGYEERTTS
jgi:nicotinate-nucleotide adenylyltransferase